MGVQIAESATIREKIRAGGQYLSARAHEIACAGGAGGFGGTVLVNSIHQPIADLIINTVVAASTGGALTGISTLALSAMARGTISDGFDISFELQNSRERANNAANVLRAPLRRKRKPGR